MAKTILEDEKKLRSNYQSGFADRSPMTLDDWYNINNNQLEQSRQRQLEDNYTQQQLLNKYLPEQMAQQGLANSGIAQLYQQQANTDYLNNRSTINSNVNTQQQDLLNQYYTQRKAEEAEQKAEAKENYDSYYQMYLNELNNHIGDNGKISQESYDDLMNFYAGVKDKIGQVNYDNALYTLDNYLENDEEKDARLERERNEVNDKLSKNRAVEEKMIREAYKEQYGYYPDDALLEKIIKATAGKIKGSFSGLKDFFKNAIWN